MPQLSRVSIFGIRLATCVLVVYWIALFTGTHMPHPPSPAAVGIKASDKVQHFTAFFGLATLLYWVVPGRRGPLRKVLVVLAIAVPYAAFDEWSQGFVSTRTVDFRDFIANCLGILAATLLYLVLRPIVHRWRSRSDFD